MLNNKNKIVGLSVLSLTIGMVGMSYAAVPLYQIFCQVTGFGGTIQRADSNQSMRIGQEMVMRFDANIAKDLDWSFKPEKVTMDLRTGETHTAYYIVKNTTDSTQVGTASFNVSPQSAGVYFNKIDCFCFTDQEVKPGEEIRMPVTFFIDPEIEKDIDTHTVKEVTLSYTFYKSISTNKAEPDSKETSWKLDEQDSQKNLTAKSVGSSEKDWN